MNGVDSNAVIHGTGSSSTISQTSLLSFGHVFISYYARSPFGRPAAVVSVIPVDFDLQRLSPEKMGLGESPMLPMVGQHVAVYSLPILTISSEQVSERIDLRSLSQGAGRNSVRQTIPCMASSRARSHS